MRTPGQRSTAWRNRKRARQTDSSADCRLRLQWVASSRSFSEIQPPTVEILSFTLGTLDGPLSRTLPPFVAQTFNGGSGRTAVMEQRTLKGIFCHEQPFSNLEISVR
jgi:hypothetical protein